MTNSISSIEIPNFKSHNITMSASGYFMNTVNGCKDICVYNDGVFLDLRPSVLLPIRPTATSDLRQLFIFVLFEG